MSKKRSAETQLEDMSIMDVVTFIDTLEKAHGVQVSGVVTFAGPVTSSSADSEDSYDIWLKSFGANKVAAIKAVAVVLGIGLKEAKDLVESVPVLLREYVSATEAEELTAIFRSQGVELSTSQPGDELMVLANLSVAKGSLEETKLDLLASDSLGLDSNALPLSRIVPINLYLTSGNNHKEVVSALSEFLDAFGFTGVGETAAEISSFFKRWWARTRDKESVQELKVRLKKMEEALEAQQIDMPKSEIDLNHATAAERLLTALGGDSKTAALHVGNLLILVLNDQNGEKHSRVITLTKNQIEMIQADQSLLRKPELLLQHLDRGKAKQGGS